MVRVSRKQLKKDVREKIHAHFVKTIVTLHTKNGGKLFLEDLLSETELEMLAKRLAALLMLSQGISSYRVHKLLNMSNTTTNRMRKEILQDKHSEITSIIKKKKERE